MDLRSLFSFLFMLCEHQVSWGMRVIVIQCEKASWRYHNHVNIPVSKKTSKLIVFYLDIISNGLKITASTNFWVPLPCFFILLYNQLIKYVCISIHTYRCICMYIIVPKKIKFIAIEHMHNQQSFNYHERWNLGAPGNCDRLTRSDHPTLFKNCSEIHPMKTAVFSQQKIVPP